MQISIVSVGFQRGTTGSKAHPGRQKDDVGRMLPGVYEEGNQPCKCAAISEHALPDDIKALSLAIMLLAICAVHVGHILQGSPQHINASGCWAVQGSSADSPTSGRIANVSWNARLVVTKPLTGGTA